MTSTLHSATGKPAKSSTTTAPSSAVPTTSTGGTKTALPATGTGASGPPGRNYSNAAATNQAEITANQAAVKTKAGPQTPDNILHNYANYTYKISLLCFKTVKDYNLVIEEGSWQAMPALAKKHCYTLFSSGGISNDASASTAERHPDFNVDFYITAMNMMGFAGIDSRSRGSNQLSMDMEVVEPIGTTLLERFESALTTDGPNWTERPLMIQVQFLGYDKEQNPVLIKPATRWIPCRLINIAFDLSESGTSYSIKFLAMSVQKHDALKNSLNLQTLYGNNVGDFCARIKEAFDEQQKLKLADQFKDSKTISTTVDDLGSADALTVASGGTVKEKVSVKSQDVADTITFDIDPAIKKGTIDVRVAQESMLKEWQPKKVTAADLAGGDYPPTNDAEDKNMVYKHNTSTRWKAAGTPGGGYHADIIDQGQTYLAFIEKIIRESTFITNQLVDPTSIMSTGLDPSESDILKDPNKGLDWFKVSYVKKLGDFDHMRNMYASNTVIQIHPYKVLDSIATKSKILPGEKGMPPPVRNYQYQYSGQNLDIQELQLNFNNAFFQALTGQSTGNTGAKGDSGKSAPKSNQKGKDKQEYNALGVGTMREAINKTTSFGGDSNATPVQKQAETLMERLYRTPGSDQMQIDLQIIGDPAYIMQDGILHQKQKLKTGTADSALSLDPASGAILSDSSDVHIYIYYKTPEDIDDKLGIVNFSRGDKRFRNSTISGYFKVLKIDTTFSGGVFSQSLNAIRLFDQFREHSLNPNDPVDADSRKSQDEVTSKGMTVAEAEHGAGAFEATGAPASSTAAVSDNITEIDSFGTIEQQQEQILNKERAIETGVDDFSTINPDAIQANEFADANVFVKQNQEEFKARIHASEFADAGFNATNITSTDVTTIAGSHDHTDAHGFTINNDGVTKHVSSAVPTNRAQRLAKKRVAWRAAQDKTTTSIIPVSSGGDPLLSNKLGTGIAQTAYNPSMEGYSSTDTTTVNNNDAQIEQYRNQMIVAGAASGAAIAAWRLGNSLTENNRTIHHSYGNSGYKSWKDLGYRIDLMEINPATGN